MWPYIHVCDCWTLWTARAWRRRGGRGARGSAMPGDVRDVRCPPAPCMRTAVAGSTLTTLWRFRRFFSLAAKWLVPVAWHSKARPPVACFLVRAGAFPSVMLSMYCKIRFMISRLTKDKIHDIKAYESSESCRIFGSSSGLQRMGLRSELLQHPSCALDIALAIALTCSLSESSPWIARPGGLLRDRLSSSSSALGTHVGVRPLHRLKRGMGILFLR